MSPIMKLLLYLILSLFLAAGAKADWAGIEGLDIEAEHVRSSAVILPTSLTAIATCTAPDLHIQFIPRSAFIVAHLTIRLPTCHRQLWMKLSSGTAGRCANRRSPLIDPHASCRHFLLWGNEHCGYKQQHKVRGHRFDAGTSAQGREFSGHARCVVEFVGLEPTTRQLWAAAMSDQLTLSNTKYSKLEEFRYRARSCWFNLPGGVIGWRASCNWEGSPCWHFLSAVGVCKSSSRAN